MEKVTVVDAMMGRGKSSAAIRYMNEHKDDRRFLYVTPFLSEVDRVCDRCDFDEPDSDRTTKSNMLKAMMRHGRNIATTHALFSIMDEEAMDLARENHYSLIIDEELPIIKTVKITDSDKELILKRLAHVEAEGRVVWNDLDYTGVFVEYAELSYSNSLFLLGDVFYAVQDPRKFRSFEEVFLLTYMFNGSLQRGYFDFFNIPYEVVGVEQDDEGYKISDKPDAPPPVDYSGLIHLVGAEENFKDSLNAIGRGKNALSKHWFEIRYRNHPDVKQLRNNLRTFFDRRTDSTSEDRIWTTFRCAEKWIYGQRGRFSTNFLPLNMKSTNAYKDATHVAYLLNRFVNPNIASLFRSKGIELDQNEFALADMLQFIWRSAIREGKPIDLYLPSKRMRDLLIGWMKATSEGGRHEAQEG